MKKFLKTMRLFSIGMAVSALSLASITPAAAADKYPSKTVTILVPYPAGGGTDIMARLISSKLSQMWHSSVIVENRPGASGLIGTNEGAKARPDGYTLVLTATPAVSIAQNLYKEMTYNPKKDLSPIVLVATSPVVWVASEQSGIKDFADVKALTKKGPVTYASSGVATVQRLAGIRVVLDSGLRLTGVPYKGGAPSLSAVLTGHVQTAFVVAPLVVPYIQDKHLDAIAVTTSERVKELPNVPTMNQVLGTTGINLQVWYGLFAPSGTPTAIVEKLNHDVNQILKMPDIKARIGKIGGIIKGGSVQEFKTFWFNDIKEFKNLVEAAHMKKL